MLIMFIVSVGVAHQALTVNAIAGDIGNGLVGAVVAGMVVITEMNLATRLGSDYAHYPATGDARDGCSGGRVAYSWRGPGLPVPLVAASGSVRCLLRCFWCAAIGYAIIGVLHMRSWLRRRKAWIASHERERLQVLGRSA